MKRAQDPEVRRRQILETAMKLFYQKGYDETSMEDIARELNVVKGLCYRYYPSKTALLAAVLEEYTEECCRELVQIVRDRTIPMSRRLRAVLEKLTAPSETGRYHEFFHKAGNEAMHEQLAMKMCRYLLPHVTEEMESACAGRGMPEGWAETAAQVLLYGLVGVWQEGSGAGGPSAERFGELAEKLCPPQGGDGARHGA